MKLHYYTGEGTSLDRMYAELLKINKNDLVTIQETIKVENTNIEYFIVKSVYSFSEVKDKYPFTNRAIKPVIVDL